jgi:hypothetical protein
MNGQAFLENVVCIPCVYFKRALFFSHFPLFNYHSFLISLLVLNKLVQVSSVLAVLMIGDDFTADLTDWPGFF